VTSKRQRAANRANSAKSTGPRSKAGKSAAKLNALLHGLATAAPSEPGADAEIQHLARAIVDDAGRADLFELARRVAEAELDLRRIRRARVTLAKLSSEISKSLPPAASPNPKPSKKAGGDKNQRKPSSLAEMALRLQRQVWGLTLPNSSRRLRDQARSETSSRKFSSVTSVVRRRDAIRRSAALTP
jgi:hypothetical protein